MGDDGDVSGAVRVRAATAGDALALHEMNEDFNGAGGPSVDDIARTLAEPRAERVLIAEADGVPVGFLCAQAFRSFCYNARYAEITELYVAPGFRRRGLARALIAAAEAGFRAEGIATFQLFTGGENAGAQALYRAMGYRATDERMFRHRPSRNEEEGT